MVLIHRKIKKNQPQLAGAREYGKWTHHRLARRTNGWEWNEDDQVPHQPHFSTRPVDSVSSPKGLPPWSEIELWNWERDKRFMDDDSIGFLTARAGCRSTVVWMDSQLMHFLVFQQAKRDGSCTVLLFLFSVKWKPTQAPRHDWDGICSTLN